MKELFQEVFERFQAKKKEEDADKIPEEPAKIDTTYAQPSLPQNEAPAQKSEGNFFDVNDEVQIKNIIEKV